MKRFSYLGKEVKEMREDYEASFEELDRRELLKGWIGWLALVLCIFIILSGEAERPPWCTL